MSDTMRLAKRIAMSGMASRRQSETLITGGHVKVNGQLQKNVATTVTLADEVSVKGLVLPTPAEGGELFRFHKPKGCLITRTDPQGRRTMYDIFPKGTPHLMPVGRLDYNSEGLLLLATNGDVAQTLMHPKTGLPRTYRVRVYGTPSAETLSKISKGLTIEGVKYRGLAATLDPDQTEGKNRWLEVTLHEGKNREIRKIFEHFGHPVTRLIRVAYGPIKLGGMRQGDIKPLTHKELAELEPWLTKSPSASAAAS